MTSADITENITWEAVIGLEIHVQLLTKSKIFSGASTAYGTQPNTQACDVSIALPGVLPVMNREAARLAVRFGLGIGAHINQRSIFARKNYFYPDLPKGLPDQPVPGTDCRHKARLNIETSVWVPKPSALRARTLKKMRVNPCMTTMLLTATPVLT